MASADRNFRVLVIAEAGVNHNGDVSTARELVKAAAKCGADYVKFQTFIPDKVNADVARYLPEIKNESDDDTQLGLIKGLCLGFEEFEILKSECETCGIGFMSTAFDMDSLEFLDGLGVNT